MEICQKQAACFSGEKKTVHIYIQPRNESEEEEEMQT